MNAFYTEIAMAKRSAESIVFGPYEAVDPDMGRLGGPPMTGDILYHNGFSYICIKTEGYAHASDRVDHQLGMDGEWEAFDDDAPEMAYDKTKVVPVGWLDNDAVLWRAIDNKGESK